jgi:hypothetical protein
LPPVFFQNGPHWAGLLLKSALWHKIKNWGRRVLANSTMFELIFLSPRITPVAKILLDGLLTNAKLRVGKEFYLVIPVWDGVFERVVNCKDCFLKYFLFKNILK